LRFECSHSVPNVVSRVHVIADDHPVASVPAVDGVPTDSGIPIVTNDHAVFDVPVHHVPALAGISIVDAVS
jgi:hypothetical protein